MLAWVGAARLRIDENGHIRAKTHSEGRAQDRTRQLRLEYNTLSMVHTVVERVQRGKGTDNMEADEQQDCKYMEHCVGMGGWPIRERTLSEERTKTRG